MSMGSDSSWVGRKPLRRIGGMSDALSIAADLGFSVAPPPSQEEIQNLSTVEKGDDLIRVLRELTAVQRKIADLQVELQGRKKISKMVSDSKFKIVGIYTFMGNSGEASVGKNCGERGW